MSCLYVWREVAFFETWLIFPTTCCKFHKNVKFELCFKFNNVCITWFQNPQVLQAFIDYLKSIGSYSILKTIRNCAPIFSDLKCVCIWSGWNVTFGPKSNVYTILKISVNWWKKVVGPQNWNGKFLCTSGLNQFFRNFERARTLSETSVASASRKNTEFYENPIAETALSFLMFKHARGVKKVFFG